MEDPSPTADTRELTWRAVLVGILLGALAAVMNVYLGLKTPFTVGASVLAATLAFFLLYLWGKPGSRLEVNMSQTLAASAGAMASAAGLLAPIPALMLLDPAAGGRPHISGWGLLCWGLSVGWLGALLAVPLRYFLPKSLAFPSGVAVAATINALLADSGEARQRARLFWVVGLVSALFAWLIHAYPSVSRPDLSVLGLGAIAALGFTLYLDTMLWGVGMLVGAHVAGSMVLGAVFAFGVVGPWIESLGWVGGEGKPSVSDWLLWPGVGIMIGDTLCSLIASISAWRRHEKEKRQASVMQPLLWCSIAAVLSVAAALCAQVVFGISPLLTFLALLVTAPLSAVAARCTGETDLNPVSQLGNITQLAFGTAGTSAGTTVITGAVAVAGASQAADLMQDWKTGSILGATPKKQLWMQLIGVPVGALVCVPVFHAMVSEYKVGSEELPVPWASVWKSVALMVSRGWEALPAHADAALLIGLAVGALVAIGRMLLPKWTPSGLALGWAFLIPAFYGLAFLISAGLLMLWQRFRPEAAERFSLMIATGLIAGSAVMGTVLTAYDLFGG